MVLWEGIGPGATAIFVLAQFGEAVAGLCAAGCSHKQRASFHIDRIRKQPRPQFAVELEPPICQNCPPFLAGEGKITAGSG